MKFLKTSVLAIAAVFAMGNLASAETVVPTAGHGYGAVTSSTATPLADGSTLIKQTTHEFWIENQSTENFPAEKVADCNATLLLSAKGAPIAFRGVCTATDIDGDTLCSNKWCNET